MVLFLHPSISHIQVLLSPIVLLLWSYITIPSPQRSFSNQLGLWCAAKVARLGSLVGFCQVVFLTLMGTRKECWGRRVGNWHNGYKPPCRAWSKHQQPLVTSFAAASHCSLLHIPISWWRRWDCCSPWKRDTVLASKDIPPQQPDQSNIAASGRNQRKIRPSHGGMFLSWTQSILGTESPVLLQRRPQAALGSSANK